MVSKTDSKSKNESQNTPELVSKIVLADAFIFLTKKNPFWFYDLKCFGQYISSTLVAFRYRLNRNNWVKTKTEAKESQ